MSHPTLTEPSMHKVAGKGHHWPARPAKLRPKPTCGLGLVGFFFWQAGAGLAGQEAGGRANRASWSFFKGFFFLF